MNNRLKQILGKAAYNQLNDSEIRTIRSIVRKHRELAQWHRVPGGLLTKLRALKRFLNYAWNRSSKLTTRHYYLAYGRKFRRYDRVDFIHNQYTARSPR